MVTTDNKAEETHGLELIQTIHAGFEANNKYGVFANPSRNQIWVRTPGAKRRLVIR